MFFAKTNSIISSIPESTIPIIILIVSIVALTIIIERTIYFWKIKTVSPEDFRKVKELILDSKWDEAKDYLSLTSNGPVTAILLIGIEYKRRASKFYQDEMKSEGYRQIHSMEKFLTGLGTIATIGPLLGVLGTVVGMIRSFAEGVGTKGAEGGIAEALITTAMGLGVSIPSYIFYNYLVRKKEERVTEMENYSDQFLQLFHEE
jgi:biopolymer transport protein ExbB/TolQ